MSMRYQGSIILPGYNPLLVPDAPTIGTATSSSLTSVTIAFTAPSNVGGGAITSYIATAKRTSDGVVFTASGASSPITVTGLTAVPFTATVAAVNLYGPSPSSAASNSITPTEPAPTVIGQAYGGGYYAGQIGVSSVATHYLVVGPVASAQSALTWKNVNTATVGADSVINGPQNTADMVADGNSTVYPAAHFCNDLSTGGQTDWYMPAKNELDICYFNLKPTTANNNTSAGVNANAVPSRGSPYTTGTPAQTSAAVFIETTGAEAFTVAPYWSSFEDTASTAYGQSFGNGGLATPSKNYAGNLVRAVRRVAV